MLSPLLIRFFFFFFFIAGPFPWAIMFHHSKQHESLARSSPRVLCVGLRQYDQPFNPAGCSAFAERSTVNKCSRPVCLILFRSRVALCTRSLLPSREQRQRREDSLTRSQSPLNLDTRSLDLKELKSSFNLRKNL